MASKISVNLDTSKENYEVYRCKQNDDLILTANILENGQPKNLAAASININARKPNNTFVIQSKDISKSGSTITANLIRDITRVPGNTLVEIQLIESGKQNTTFTFILDVDSSVIQGALESGNKITALEDLKNAIDLAEEAKKRTEELVETGGAATKEEMKNYVGQLPVDGGTFFETYDVWQQDGGTF